MKIIMNHVNGNLIRRNTLYGYFATI